ncbi:MAG: cyclic nucleotide-binding domain-containing protein, partial [Candidatus Dadabacteria bacterium]|nr:cyclic nucleotide-binding domain-containing protein [Candidatus Dadabacteria bacterium]
MNMDTLTLFKNSKDSISFSPGDTIFEVGSEPDVMYVIQEGEVDIVAGDTVVETLGPGEIFGEMALVDKKPRSAAAKAHTDCKVVPIDENRFKFLIQQTPF